MECPPCRVRIATAIASAPTRPASVHASQTANHPGDLLIAGFAKELFEAQSDEPEPARTAPSGPQSNSARSGKSAKQQSKPTKPASEPAIAPAVVTTPPQSPLRMAAFGLLDAHAHSASALADNPSAALAPSVPSISFALPELPPASLTSERNAQPSPAPPVPPPPANRETKTIASSPHHGATPGELAFAARVQPAAATNETTSFAKRPATAPTQPQELTSKRDEKDAETLSPDQTSAPAAPLPSSASNQSAFAVAPVPTPAPAMAVHAAAPPQQTPLTHAVEPKIVELPKPATAPLRELSLQVDQAGASNVQVRVMQQAGELRVAVRTGDADLAHGLQQGLNDLVGRLQENGFRAEAWRPGAAAPQYAAASETNHNPSNSHQGDSQSFSGGSQHQRQEERRQNQSSRPAWVEELEGSLNGRDSQNQGATYGIRS